MSGDDTAVTQYLSVADMAQSLQLSPRTVRQLLVTGKMCKFVRLGRAIRVRTEVFAEWAEQQEADSFSPGVRKLR